MKGQAYLFATDKRVVINVTQFHFWVTFASFIPQSLKFVQILAFKTDFWVFFESKKPDFFSYWIFGFSSFKGKSVFNHYSRQVTLRSGLPSSDIKEWPKSAELCLFPNCYRFNLKSFWHRDLSSLFGLFRHYVKIKAVLIKTVKLSGLLKKIVYFSDTFLLFIL